MVNKSTITHQALDIRHYRFVSHYSETHSSHWGIHAMENL
ncbi:hypothetical protein C427_3065 [Paraglaciecola psychrophila 170]|uniref:Uncharacterized protein n=1 Tax=Paraglaciecola psychrophila 170 TaxID=1129794 RepID=M4RSH7_9ALTE|nr:hypothetical protein C427_3065 [Paraglaciecola psychrophila 170]